MAVEEVNAKGGVNVRGTRLRLEMTHLDVGSPKEAIQVFERLLTVEKVTIVVDGLYSSVEYALGPVIKTKDALVMWSAGNDPATTSGVPNAFRNSLDGGMPLMRVTEAFLKKQGVKRVACYGQTGHADFKRFVEEYLPKVSGIEIVAQDWYPFGEKDFFPILTKIKGLKPDGVLAHGFISDAITLHKQAREIGLLPGPVWLNQYAAAPLMMDEAPEKSRRFFENYARKFGERGFGIWAEHAHDSVWLVVKAMEKAGTTDDIGRLIPALQGITTEEMPDLLGPYKPGRIFDAERQAYPRIIVAQWRQSQLVPVFADYGMG
jgi:branched-chain amino acid transport system substrate-binding protein